MVFYQVKRNSALCDHPVYTLISNKPKVVENGYDVSAEGLPFQNERSGIRTLNVLWKQTGWAFP
jgi:hypothetical protein